MLGDMSGLAKESPADLEELRARLGKMTDSELIAFGKEMRELVYPT
jgi:hypothetical protein